MWKDATNGKDGTANFVTKETGYPPFLRVRKYTLTTVQARSHHAGSEDFLPHPSPYCHKFSKWVSKEYELCRRLQKKMCKTSILLKKSALFNGTIRKEDSK